MLVKPLVRPIVRAIAGNPTASLGSGFSPTSLFADGSKGVAYDNNDLSSFFLDSALTTPATVNGLVGGQLDKSGNGFHRTQATTGSKPVLRGTPTGANLVTNGDFASGTGWTAGSGWAIGSGVATATTSTGTLTHTLAATASKVYRLTYTLVTRTAGSIQPSFGGALGASRSAAGTYVEYLTTTTTAVLSFASTALDGSIDNVEVVDVSAGQVTAPYGLHYDGVDDFMQTAAVDFTATDKMFVCAGVRKLSDAALGYLFNTNTTLTVAGTQYIAAPGDLAGRFWYYARGTIEPGTAASTSPLPGPNLTVLTCQADIAGDSRTMRVNGVANGSSATDLGTGNFGNYALYFGRLYGISGPYNGLDFGMVICGKTLTSTQISQTERYIAQRTGVTI